MAQIQFDFQFITGAADDALAGELGRRSSDGWEVLGITGRAGDIVVCLRRERDFQVAQSLMNALEETQTVEAISTLEIPAEEFTTDG